jgi:HD superfamily phosphohydrolase
MKTIRDPIHGDMSFSDEEMALVDTPEFQRLRGIKQLGTSYLVFPGARHSRFEHSLGTCWLTGRIIDRLKDPHYRNSSLGSGAPFDDEETRLMRVAALLHDITHIPFGHTFEDERRILPAHDKSEERLNYFLQSAGLGRVLRQLGLREKVFALLARPKEVRPPYRAQIVSGPICSDLLDYLRRDAFFCGLNLNFDDRIFRYMALEAGQLCFNLFSDRGFRQDAWSELIHLLRMRFHLTERVYFHHAKMVSGAMLSAVLEGLLQARAIERSELVQLTDDALLYLMQRKSNQASGVAPLLEAFLTRRLYKRVYMVARDPLKPNFPNEELMERFQRDFHFNEGDARSELERQLARHLRIRRSAVILYAPDTGMRLKEADVLVRKDAGPPVHLESVVNPELDGLRLRHRCLWRFFLFMDPLHADRFAQAARFLEERLGLPNQLGQFHQGQMTLSLDL